MKPRVPQPKGSKTMTTQNNPFYAPVSETAEFETLEPGSYNGVCIGVVAREFPNFNDKSVMDTKVQFVFQIVEGGQQYYLRSKPCKVILNEKSNLFLLINSWTKASLEKMAEGFECQKMVGFGAQIVVNNTDYNGKTYADIANILPLKKGVKVQVTAAEIPAFLAKGALAQQWAAGITVKKEEPATGAAAVQKKGSAAQAPANARITQGNPAQYVPPAAPPIQEQAAPEVDDDDDSDLPF